jgi:hypothetical protein
MEELKKELQQMIADRKDKVVEVENGVVEVENGELSTIGKVVQACYINAQSDMAAELLQKYFGESE